MTGHSLVTRLKGLQPPGWFPRPPGSAGEIAELETQYGIRLPGGGYRQPLLYSNGGDPGGSKIIIHDGKDGHRDAGLHTSVGTHEAS